MFRFVALTVLYLIVDHASAHSFLIEPKADYQTNNKPECRIGGPPQSPNDNCPGPCIAEDSMFFDKNAITNIWQRGQAATLVWTKNNHNNGFVRLSLVPISQRMDKSAHDKMAFRFSCWAVDEHLCPANGFCGTQNKLYRLHIKVPDVYPDGRYVLGWAWYGGTENNRASMGDYWSCAFIEIRGGMPVAKSYEPIWESGLDKNTCSSGVDRLGICFREPCDPYNSRNLPQSEMVPQAFSNNNKPAAIQSSWFGGLLSSPPSPFFQQFQSTNGQSTSVHRGSGSRLARVLSFEFFDVGNTNVFGADLSKPVYLNGRKINIRAVTEGSVAYVNFYVNGNYIKTEGVSPFFIGGDTDSQSHEWTGFPASQWFQLRAQAFRPDGSSDTLDVSMNLVP
jgi:hypothetical protein